MMNLTTFGSDSAGLLSYLNATYPLPNGARYLWKTEDTSGTAPGAAPYLGTLFYMRGATPTPLMSAGGDTPDDALFYVEQAYSGQEESTQIFLIKREGNAFDFFLGRVPVAVRQAYELAVATNDTVTASIIKAKIQVVIDKGSFTGSEDWTLPAPQIVSPIKTVPSIVSTVNDADAAAAVAKIEGFLNTNHPLPSGWMYQVKPFVMVETNTQTGQNISTCTIRATAVYVGGGPQRDDVGAGEITVSSDVFFEPWRRCGERFEIDALWVFQQTASRCKTLDALAVPQLQAAGSSAPEVLPPAPLPDLITVVTPTLQPQGVDSSGQQPWDAQPDVIQPAPVPEVVGTDYGEGYTGTTITPEFLDWLNLTVPDAAEVQEILSKPVEKTKYLAQYAAVVQEAAKPKSDVSIPAYTLAELYDDPIKPIFSENEYEGAGIIPKPPAPSDYSQKPPTNLDVTVATTITTDNVALMLAGSATDFLNMVAGEYRQTLLKVASISKARADLNAIIESGDGGRAESFLRYFDAAAYAEGEPVKPEPPAETKDDKTIWIVLGVLAGIVLLARSGKVKA